MRKFNLYAAMVCFVFLCATAPDYGVVGLLEPLLENNDDFLKRRCDFYGLPYDDMLALRNYESGDNPRCLERKKGRIISYGLFQCSSATGVEYCKSRGLPVPQSIENALLDPRFNTEVACYSIARYWRILRCWDSAKSAHNLGLEGLREYRARTGHRVYSPYVDAVRKRKTEISKKTIDKQSILR